MCNLTSPIRSVKDPTRRSGLDSGRFWGSSGDSWGFPGGFKAVAGNSGVGAIPAGALGGGCAWAIKRLSDLPGRHGVVVTAIITVMWEVLDTVLLVTAAICLLLFNAGGVLMVIFQLPGTWLILMLTALYAWLSDAGSLSWVLLLLVLVILAIIGEVLETLGSVRGARKAGGTKIAAVLAIVGSIVGAVVGTILIWSIPVVGTLIGGCVGAGLGSIAGDILRGRRLGEAGVAGKGAAIGKLWGTVAKVAVAVVMWLVAAFALFV